MKTKTPKRPSRSKPAAQLKDIKPRRNPKGGEGIAKFGSKRLILQGDGTYDGAI